MKNKIKHLISSVIVIVLLCALSVCASAEEYVTDTTESIDESTEENFFSKAYGELSEYAGEILCALTFAGSLILAIAYKKGLLPLMQKSLMTIGNAVNKIKDNAKETAEKSSQLGESIQTNIKSAKETLDTLANRINSLDLALKESLEKETEAKRQSREIRIIMDTQIEMLRDIFMSAALPQYQKDAIGEKIAKMKGAISENAVDE